MKKKSVYKSFLTYLFLIVIVTILLGVGYAQITPLEIDVDAIAQLDRQTGVVISNVSYVSNNNANPSLSSINTYYKTNMDSTIVLGNDSSSTITYQVTIVNLASDDYEFDGVVYDNSAYDNQNITFDLTGITIGDTLLVDDTVTFNITFRYTGNDTTYNELNSYLNFKFRRANSAYVTFEANGGMPVPQTLELYIGDQIGTLPEPSKVICQSYGEGSYKDRGCTFVGEFLGWYLEPNFVTLVSDTYVVNADTTLYAKWHSYYEYYSHIPLIAFNGVNEYLDTGINLYSEDNINKDFDIVFDIVDIDYTYQASGAQQQPTIMNSKDESQGTYPGFVLRFNTSNSSLLYSIYRWNNSSGNKNFSTSALPIHMEYKRRNGVITFSAYTDNTNFYTDYTMYNQANWTMTTYAKKNLVFGSSYNGSGTPFRFFKGSLANIEVTAYET